jgi:hypothetical protein
MFIANYKYTTELLKGNNNIPDFLVTTEQLVKSYVKDYQKSSKSSGLILAAGNVTWFSTDGFDNKEYRSLPMLTAEIVAARWANILNANDWVSVEGSACISGLIALKQAKALLEELDEVYIINLDYGVSKAITELFKDLKVLSEDSVFKLGFGVSIVKLVRKKTSIFVSDINIKRVISDNVMGVSKEGYKKIISNTNVDYIKVHGTNTVENEIEEQLALKELNLTQPQLRYKQNIGHTMGSCTLLEMCKVLDEVKSSVLHLTAGMGNMYGSFITNYVE